MADTMYRRIFTVRDLNALKAQVDKYTDLVLAPCRPGRENEYSITGSVKHKSVIDGLVRKHDSGE